jgi:two-component system LytT family sensor kinase
VAGGSSEPGPAVRIEGEEGPLAGETRRIFEVNFDTHHLALKVTRQVDRAAVLRAARFEDEHGFVGPATAAHERRVRTRIDEYVALALRPAPLWLVHVAACAAIGAVFAGWQTALDIVFNPYADPAGGGAFLPLWSDKLFNGCLSSLVLYAGIVMLTYALDSRARLAFEQTQTAQLNERLSQVQLDALKRQIEPHFLFNTLNAVAGLVREGRGDAAIGTIVAVSEFLRRTLADTARAEVPLSDELAFARSYLEIQKIRFAERLQLSVDIPGELDRARVPYLILQPLVENAVKHGIARYAQGGSIEISAARRNGLLVLRVGNDGPSLSPEWQKAPGGIGIANVRLRLQRLYGMEFDLRLRNRARGGVEATVSLPMRAGEADG